MLGKIDSTLKSFDKFGEPIAKLKMAGMTQFKTRLGGICGLAIYSLMV